MHNTTHSYTPAPKEETLQFLRTFARLYAPENAFIHEVKTQDTHGVRQTTALELLN